LRFNFSSLASNIINHNRLPVLSFHPIYRRVAPYTPTRSCVHIGVLKKKKIKSKTNKIGDLSQFCLSCLGLLVLLLPMIFKLFGFSIFRPWVYLMKVIPETRRTYYSKYLRVLSRNDRYIILHLIKKCWRSCLDSSFIWYVHCVKPAFRINISI
jgi:hypothetical protein